ncbi:hypothetical protein JCM10213v2_002686 [Rhodosporidiobolus nylandii]
MYSPPPTTQQTTSPYASMVVPSYDTAESTELSQLQRREFEALTNSNNLGGLVALKEQDKAYVQKMKGLAGVSTSSET